MPRASRIETVRASSSGARRILSTSSSVAMSRRCCFRPTWRRSVTAAPKSLPALRRAHASAITMRAPVSARACR